MIRRAMAIALLVVMSATVLSAPAYAETEAQLKARLEELKRESSRAGAAFDDAYWELDETESRLTKTSKQLVSARKKLKAAKAQLNRRARSIYRRDDLDLLDFLVGAADFEQFVTRFEHLNRIGTSDAEVVGEVKTRTRQLTAARKKLAAQRTKQSQDVRALRSRRDALQKRLRSTESEFKAVKARLNAVRSGGRVPSGVAAVAGPNGMVFPVVGSYYYSDTWGASRGGGRRRHKGTDIMAPTGTPLVAITSGTVRTKSNGLGGRTIWLSGDNGWSFYYAHLNSYVVTSGRVRAGQVIGTVGYSGNAAASAPHLHLQIHPGGGSPVNPYPYLRSME
ncbi:MAG: peptidoglycan DD-metalloendopeptidase family protein [Coriobacteriia bacterium]|nr:peptidoglycan DD-metalloendopeptidase family protein [Coriobacteriia bacterium]